MSSLKSGLATIAFAGLCGTFAVVGCSADGTGILDLSGGDQPEEAGAQLPTGNPEAGDEAVDAGKPKDAGKEAAPPDAGPPPPVAGTPCTAVNEIKKKKCGACGTQETVCLADTSGAKWSEYGLCTGEVAGGCIPGIAIDQACGNCGTQKKTCSTSCVFTTSTCAGQPPMSCVPGSIELSGAGCPSADVFLQRTCSATCTPGNFGGSCVAPPTSIAVGPTVGSISSTIAILTADNLLPRFNGFSCPASASAFSTTISTPYAYVQVTNPLAKAVTVTIATVLAPGGTTFGTSLAAYDGATGPTDAAGRMACLKTGYSTSSFTSLAATKAVPIAAGGTVSVYVGAYAAASVGKVKLDVQTLTIAD